ncbi:MAG: hypothetical protein QOK23_4635 [Gammaproteobacteria bacterium]|jgi:hypothetical protein|nr:hypothetical protein [Gammaproteobacteria bacterium]
MFVSVGGNSLVGNEVSIAFNGAEFAAESGETSHADTVKLGTHSI